MTTDFIRHEESIANSITGEGADGNIMQLGSDCLIYFKCMAFEQGVLNRLRQFDDQNLALDIQAGKGFVYLGDIEAVKAHLHSQLDEMFDMIMANRLKELEQREKSSQTEQ